MAWRTADSLEINFPERASERASKCGAAGITLLGNADESNLRPIDLYQAHMFALDPKATYSLCTWIDDEKEMATWRKKVTVRYRVGPAVTSEVAFCQQRSQLQATFLLLHH